MKTIVKQVQHKTGIYEIIIDDIFDYLFDESRWYIVHTTPSSVNKDRLDKKFYVTRNCLLRKGEKHTTEYLHKTILTFKDGPAPEGMICDHINGNSLDCRASNLRWVTKQKNAQNKTQTHSKYVGVSYNQTQNIWLVNVNKQDLVQEVKSKNKGNSILKCCKKWTELDAANWYAMVTGNTELIIRDCRL